MDLASSISNCQQRHVVNNIIAHVLISIRIHRLIGNPLACASTFTSQLIRRFFLYCTVVNL
jgi:hypothetical protein